MMMRMRYHFSFLVFIFVINNCLKCDSANILLLEELPSPSHHLWFRSVTTELINRGHNVTVVSSELDTIQLKNLHQIHMEKVHASIYNSSDFEFNLIEMGAMNSFLQIGGNLIFTAKVCQGFTMSKGWQQLQNYPDPFQFHLVIHDFPVSSCLLAFLSKFNYPPVIGMTAFSDFTFVPHIIQSALIPSTSTHFLFKEDMSSTFICRLKNFVLNSIVYFLQQIYVDPLMDKLINQAVDGKYQVLPVKELRQKSSLILFNYNEIIDGMLQLPPNVIGVGGLQIQLPKKLSMDLGNIANNATNGLVLFSLGTNVKSEMLGTDTIVQILKAFERLSEYTFLWKIDLTNISLNIPNNVYIRKWIPQNDILGHENTKLFITHGGLLSTQEAVYHQVPMLGIPVMVDQFLNVDRSVEKGIANRINIKEITNDTLYEKLNEMLSNPMYKENIKVMSKYLKDQKELPLDRALWWIEWVLRNPNSYVINRGRNLNFFQIQSIDVISVLTVTALALTYILWLFVKTIFIFVFQRKKNENKTKLE